MAGLDLVRDCSLVRGAGHLGKGWGVSVGLAARRVLVDPLLPERASPPLSSDARGLWLLLLDQKMGWRESVTRFMGLAAPGAGDPWKQM